MILEIESGDYIQCAGIKKRLTVETRRYNADKQFRHMVWGKGSLTGFPEQIECAEGNIEVDRSQVLTMRDARLLIAAFLEGDEVPIRYQRTDISHRFDPVPGDIEIRNRAWNWPDRRNIRKQKVEQTGPANHRPFGTSGMAPADSASRAGAMPEASGDS
jgi:hypothetical protein